MAKVGLIFGGRSVEHEVSIASARTIAQSLLQARHRVVPLGMGVDGGWLDQKYAQKVLDGGIDCFPQGHEKIAQTFQHVLSADVDVLFPIIHGSWGEDGSLQGLCEMLDIPYVGTGVTSSAIAMDKIICKQLLQTQGIPVVGYGVVTKSSYQKAPRQLLDTLLANKDLVFPLFVKPSCGGSSVGVTKVEVPQELGSAIEEALRFDERVLIERGIDGRELECAVLGYRRLEASIIGEILSGQSFYDYSDKYIKDDAQLLAPIELPEGKAEEIQRLSLEAFQAISGWGMARVDFLLEKNGNVFVNEINTLPGFTEISMYPRLWNLSGVSLPQLVDRLVSIAFERHRDRTVLDQDIKKWIDTLRVASR